jgi:hypothetical protein
MIITATIFAAPIQAAPASTSYYATRCRPPNIIPETVELNVTKTGDLSINGVPADWGKIESSLKTIAAKNEIVYFHLKDERIPPRNDIADALKHSGVTRHCASIPPVTVY